MDYSPIVQDDKDEDIYTLSKKLFDLAVHAEWDKIVEIYEKDPNAHTTKITKSGDTALHLAVQGGKEDAVEKLVNLIVGYSPNNCVVVLGLKNKRGDTPLHFTASMGNLRMCYKLAHSKPELIGIRNNEEETPLFVAAANGKKEAFLCLHSLIPEAGREEAGLRYGRKTKGGDTILHCALEGDYIDLAFQIITRFPGLGNRVNERGCSPLHLLASNPSAFRSGSRFGIIDGIIYNCIFVNRLTVDPEETSNFMNSSDYVNFFFFLKNVCVHFYDFFLGLFESLGRRRSTAAERATDTESQVAVRQTSQVLPPNQTNQTDYYDIFDFLKLVCKAMFIILVVGHHRKIEKMLEKKKKHALSIQIMKILLKESSGLYDYNGQKPGFYDILDPEVLLESAPYDIRNPDALLPDRSPSDAGFPSFGEEPNSSTASSQSNEIDAADDKEKRCLEVFKMLLLALDGAGGETKRNNLTKKETPILIAEKKKETPILIAAKNGIIEMVRHINKKFPLAINDINADGKNIVLLAVENRQTDVYKLLCNLLKDDDGAFRKVDIEGNSALHLAAKLGGHRPWLIPGAALQMQWELKWYEFVKNSKPADIFPKYNNKGQTAGSIFTETHESLAEKGGQWLTTTSESCSLVAALIATVAFATATTVPGGVDQSKGTPTLEKQPAFDIFAIAALIALSLSVTSLVMFLSILTSRYQEKDFRISLPRKLLMGLTSLFLAIVAMLVSFCAGHFFVLKDDLKYKAIFVYAVTCFPITMFYVIVQFPLYCDLVWAAMSKVPRRSYKVDLS